MSRDDWVGIAALAFVVLLNVGLLIYRLRHPESVPTRHYGCEGGSCTIPSSLPTEDQEEKKA